MGNETERWAWLDGLLFAANPDGSVPPNSRVVLSAERDEHGSSVVNVSGADARKIAAAPELLEALLMLLGAASGRIQDFNANPAGEAARAAIAKAEGK